jgi:peptidoglycan hydrolase CwlO-like protein
LEDKDLLELLNKIYSELNFGYKTISEDIDNLKYDQSNNSNLLKNLDPKIKQLIKVKENFKKQLDDLNDKIEALSSPPKNKKR